MMDERIGYCRACHHPRAVHDEAGCHRCRCTVSDTLGRDFNSRNDYGVA